MDKKTVFYTVRKIIIPLYLYSVLFHYIWEMLQMPLYESMPYSYISSWIVCFFATLGDVNIVISIWFVGFILFKSIWWFLNMTPLKLAVVLGIGVGVTTILEIQAVKTDRWEYSAIMPVLPVLKVGISPLLQMTFLPLVVLNIVKKRTNFQI